MTGRLSLPKHLIFKMKEIIAQALFKCTKCSKLTNHAYHSINRGIAKKSDFLCDKCYRQAKSRKETK